MAVDWPHEIHQKSGDTILAMKRLPHLPLRALIPIALGVLGVCQPLSADFSGYYDLGTSTIYSTDGSSIVGNWTYTISTFGTGSAVVDTTGQPGTLILAALAFPDSRAPVSSARPAGAVHIGEALAEARILAPNAGTFSFDVDTSVSTTIFGMSGALVAFDSTTTYDLTSGSHFELTLDAGEEFGFRATAVNDSVSNPTRGAGLLGLPALANGFGGNEFIISNTVFTPVPEASTTAAVVGLAGALGIAVWRRRQPVTIS